MSASGSAAAARSPKTRRSSDGCAIFTSWPSTPPCTNEFTEEWASCCSVIHRPGSASASPDRRYGRGGTPWSYFGSDFIRTEKVLRLLQSRHGDAVTGELIGALVLVVTGMALDPVPAHFMRFQRRVQPLPEIDILDRLLVGGAPAIPFPAVKPAGDALAHILAVGGEIDHAGLFQRLQRRDRRHQLHAVVGGVRFATLEFFFDVAECEY